MDFGIDWAGPSPHCDSDADIHIPETVTPSSSISASLLQHIDPLASCDNYGISIYMQALHIVIGQ